MGFQKTSTVTPRRVPRVKEISKAKIVKEKYEHKTLLGRGIDIFETKQFMFVYSCYSGIFLKIFFAVLMTF